MDFDINTFDDELDEKPVLPSSPTNFKSTHISDEENDDLAPIALNAGKRTALINKKSTDVKIDIKKETKQEIKKETISSPPLRPASPVEELPDASEWLDVNNTLSYEIATEFQNITRVSLEDVTDDEDNMLFFWTDFKEIGDSLALFGKVKAPSGDYVSAFLFVRSSKRELYFLPREKKVVNGVETNEAVEISDVYEEVDKLMSNHGVKEFASKPEERKYCFEIADFVAHNEADTYFIFSIALKLQMMALSKQLTNLAGNSWARTLSGTRAERNEYILLHQFYKQGYIVPDKGGNQVKSKGGNKHNDIDEELDHENSSGTKKKDKYKGGLVFEPEKGLYDHIILVMDFNSLYPSIIQEYNICFTTVERQLGTDERKADEEEQVPEVPDSSIPMGIFPRLVQNLVQRRRAVKGNMKDPKATPVQLAQWDIKQQALKLTANSMYGCLGFTKSRFYARPLAVLTTFKGREILTNTKELAESNGLKVIYGDTDSVMINTNVDIYDEAIKIGNDFKRQVNERYRLLEIDTDNVFRRMLLHAKKKYAAVNMSVSKDGQIKTSIEVKGLDMKRREYCDMSKEASQYALNQILGDMPSEEALEHIHEYLRELSTRIRENKIPLVKLIIRNKLGKHPKDYPQGHTMPHVQVAKRRIEKGEIVKIDDVIAYIIAADSISDESVDGGQTPSGKHVADRAYTLAEFKTAPGGPLKPDVEYYLTRQILPPLERLCAPIEGTDAIRLADCLGLDTEKYKQSHIAREGSGSSIGLDMSAFQTTIDDAERFRYASQLRLRCSLYKYLSRCGRRYVDMKNIFGFM
ncbi:hypothetical protein D0Z03_002542 [Geotrichum reessii]|nr:hypothetical protein D0Z03_002542 [Galactomyces reessii]